MYTLFCMKGYTRKDINIQVNNECLYINSKSLSELLDPDNLILHKCMANEENQI